MSDMRGIRRGMRAGWVLSALLSAASTQPKVPAPTATAPAAPQALFGDLFVAVQTEAIYGDGKTFVDAVPKAAPAVVLNEYHTERPTSPEALKHFVADHFVLPVQAESIPSPPEKVSIVTHIDQLWNQLTRETPVAPPYSSALPIPRPYVVPGGRFAKSITGIRTSPCWVSPRAVARICLADMVGDFAYLIDTYGHIPNGARTII